MASSLAFLTTNGLSHSGSSFIDFFREGVVIYYFLFISLSILCSLPFCSFNWVISNYCCFIFSEHALPSHTTSWPGSIFSRDLSRVFSISNILFRSFIISSSSFRALEELVYTIGEGTIGLKLSRLT